MKKILSTLLTLLFLSSIAIAGQSTNSSTTINNQSGTKTARKRGPVFRASKDQVQQAQRILKDRGFYGGEQTGKLDADTRTGLKKYQTADSLKVTGTLNKVTLEKMGITLTDKQRVM